MKTLSVIQGDSFNATLTLEHLEDIDIDTIKFTCPSLHIEKELYELTNEKETWGFSLTPLETVNLRVGQWDFYVTAVTKDRDQYTVIYKGIFIVNFKRNKSTPVPPHAIIGIGYTED